MKEIKTLSYKIGTILLNNIFDILKKTKDHEEVRVYEISHLCFCCCSILTDNRIKKEDKIDLFEKIAKKCVDDIDKNIEEYKNDLEKSRKQCAAL